MNNRNQSVGEHLPVRRPIHLTHTSELHDRLAVVADDLEAAIKRGDLGRIIEAARDQRRIVFELEDDRFATRG